MPVALVSNKVRTHISPQLPKLHCITNASLVNKLPNKEEDKTINGFLAPAAILAGASFFPTLTPPLQ